MTTAAPPIKKSGNADARTTFTGAKLDWLECVFFDRRLLPIDKVIAFVIVQHINIMTGETMLSDRTIGDKAATTDRNVRRARQRLRQHGWLTWKGTETANIYRQSFQNMNSFQDMMLVAREARASARAVRRKAAGPPPWEEDGVSRATYYRLRQKLADAGVRSETVSCGHQGPKG